jgi:O-antigen/teichoic acid export membrane protein
MNKKRILMSLSISFFVEIINKISPLFILYLAKTRLGIERFGYSQFAVNLIEAAIPFIVFGYTIVGSKEVARLKEQPDKLGSMLSSMMVLRLVHALLTTAGLAFVCGAFSQYQPYLKLVMMLSFILIASAFEMTHVLIAYQKIHLVNAALGFIKLLTLFAMYKFVNDSEDANLYAILSVATNAVVAFVSMFLGLRLIKLHPPQWHWMRELFRKGCHFALIYIGLNLLDRYDVILAEWFSGTVGAGLYAGPARISQSINSIIVASSLIFLSELVGLKNHDKMSEHVSLSLAGASLLLMPVCAGVWFVDASLISLIFGQEYVGVARVLSILVQAVGIQSVITILGFQVLALKDETRKFALYVFAGLMLGVAVAFALVSHYALYGIAIGAVAAKFLSAFLVAQEARKSLMSFPWRWILRTVFATVCMVLVLFFSKLTYAPVLILIGGLTYTSAIALLFREEIQRWMFKWKASR